MSRVHEVGVGCLVLVATGILAFMALQIGAIKGIGTSFEVTARFPDAAGLTEGAVVSVAGVQVGRVESLAVDNGTALATLSIENDSGLRSDAKVAVRARSVLGEKYIEVTSSSTDAPLLAEGAVLIAEGKQVEIDQLVSQMGPLLSALDPEIFKVIGETLREDPERAKRMLDDAERLLHNAALASDELPEIAARTKATLASVERTSDQARPVIAKAGATLSRVDGTIEKADRIVDAIDPAQIDAMFDELSAMVKDGRAVVAKVDTATGKVTTLLDKADSFTKEDFLRVTQEEGFLIRLLPRKAETVLRQQEREN